MNPPANQAADPVTIDLTEETAILIFEPTGTPNIGDAGGDRTREPDDLG
jgi:hypothetical protein